MKKILLIALTFLGIVTLFVAVKSGAMMTKSPQADGYLMTGRIVQTNDLGEPEVIATWVRQGDSRGWHLAQTYNNSKGEVTKVMKQWCIVDKGVFVDRGGDKGIQRLGPCNLFPKNYTGTEAATAKYVGEDAAVSRHVNNGRTTEDLVSPKFGVRLKMTMYDAAVKTTVVDETLTIQRIKVDDSIFIVQ